MSMRLEIITDLTAARDWWQHFYRASEKFFHQWDVRLAFHHEYAQRLHFVGAWENSRRCGFLPLCFAPEIGQYVYFAGELWQEKTWLESNCVFAENDAVRTAMLSSLDAPLHLRYCEGETFAAANTATPPPAAEIDELGYHFYPAHYEYNFQQYWEKFSSKTRKKFAKELAALNASGVEFFYNRHADIEWFITTNLRYFGATSYFADPRFLRGFKRLIAWLAANDYLRITSVEIGGTLAAVDIGALLANHYTVLAGGAAREFIGVAKLINFHHLQFACAQRLTSVDFLCGDFGWKERFLLTPRPLYLIRRLNHDC